MTPPRPADAGDRDDAAPRRGGVLEEGGRVGSSSSFVDAASNDDDRRRLSVQSQDVLRLVMHHLTECGLHGSCRALREESGVGCAGVSSSAASNLRGWARNGEWGEVLGLMETLDARRLGGSLASLMADVHEMTVLELADAGEVELAHAALRMVADDMDDAPSSSVEGGGDTKEERRSASVERRVHALSALRSLHGVGNGAGDTAGGGGDAAKSSSSSAAGKGDRLIPPDYYGPNNQSRQRRRDDLARRIGSSIPVAPASRLVSLLQQAVKWQVHTGQMPEVRDLWEDDQDEEEGDDDGDGETGGDGGGSKRKKKEKKKSRKRRRKKKFDLVLGEVDAIAASGTDQGDGNQAGSAAVSAAKKLEKIASRPTYEIKFGKKSVPECASFLPDGSGLVTGSSDGFVEIWDPDAKYAELRMDLKYQKDDELMTHDGSVTALSISADGTLLGTGDSDGTIKVWKVGSGTCLRKFDRAHGGAISCLDFSADGSHVLSGGRDGNCREFGLRASRMLKEFRGHSSYVNSCSYAVVAAASDAASHRGGQLLVVTGSADGTVRVWDGRTSECRRVLRPPPPSGGVGPAGGSSSNADVDAANDAAADIVGGRNVHTVLPLHSPPGTVLVVPRSPRAYLMTLSGGAVVRTFDRDDARIDGGEATDGGRDFVTAVVSPSNRWAYLAAEDGRCFVFDVSTGKIEKTIRDFAEESTGSTGGGRSAEVTGLAHHPHKSLIAAYSNEKGQKRGLLTLWR